MSRTHKDVKREFRSPENDYNYGRIRVPYSFDSKHWQTGEPIVCNSFCYMEVAGAKTKKRRSVDTSWHWTSQTPAWWVRVFMNRPQRSRGNAWARRASKMSWEELEDTLPPDVSRKPHYYYW